MTAEPSVRSAIAGLSAASSCGGAPSLEVRWIIPGQLGTAVARWFGRFQAGVESREDRYLVDPQLHGLSVKVRGETALEVKAYRGSPGVLHVPGRASGRMESWVKWSFPCTPLRQGGDDLAGWTPVRKRRRISRFAPRSGRMMARSPEGSRAPGCQVELTEIRIPGQDWWTLGFEVTGPSGLLRSGLEAAAAAMFAEALPGGAGLGLDESTSYAGWLGHGPGGPEHPGG